MKGKEEKTIIVIPDGGDSPDTEIWYIKELERYYKARGKKKLNVLVFKHSDTEEAVRRGVVASTLIGVRDFIQKGTFTTAEIHAQGGLGAYVAYEFLRYVEAQDHKDHYGCKINLTDVFMVGGAPSVAMTSVARWFHLGFAPFWYRIRKIVPFFADDPPNPECDETINKIRDISTQAMQANPELYRNQLVLIGSWDVPKGWQVPAGVRVWFVPNGETLRGSLRDNTYDDAKARACWESHGVRVTERPGKNFSFYSMMPARELFMVMDKVR